MTREEYEVLLDKEQSLLMAHARGQEPDDYDEQMAYLDAQFSTCGWSIDLNTGLPAPMTEIVRNMVETVLDHIDKIPYDLSIDDIDDPRVQGIIVEGLVIKGLAQKYESFPCITVPAQGSEYDCMIFDQRIDIKFFTGIHQDRACVYMSHNEYLAGKEHDTLYCIVKKNGDKFQLIASITWSEAKALGALELFPNGRWAACQRLNGEEKAPWSINLFTLANAREELENACRAL